MNRAKRAKIESDPGSISHSNTPAQQIEPAAPIFQLNDDCFESIFEFVCPKDLNALGAVCVRIRELVKIYFTRKYAFKCIEIARINGAVGIKNYAALKDVIRNVSFRGVPKQKSKWSLKQSTNHDTDLLNFYKNSACNKNPKMLRFENMALEQKDGAMMNDFLKNVEAVEFINCESDHFYGHVLRRCKKIKSLTVKQSASAGAIYGPDSEQHWLQELYEFLENLDIHLNAETDHTVLNTFVKKNPQIKKFACRSRLSLSQLEIQNVMSAIDGLNLEELFLTIGGKCDFRNIYAQLLDISKRPGFKRLSLEFRSADVKDILIDNLNNLANIEKLYALHITTVVDFSKDLPTHIDLLTNLKELHLINLANCDYSAKRLAKVTPNLEILIVRNSCYFTPSVVDFIQPFIEHLPKLKKIVLAYDVWPRIKQRLESLNKKRQQLHDACTVVIWTNPLKSTLKDETMPILTGKTLIRMSPLHDEHEHF